MTKDALEKLVNQIILTADICKLITLDREEYSAIESGINRKLSFLRQFEIRDGYIAFGNVRIAKWKRG
jgi:hypothetical protein